MASPWTKKNPLLSMLLSGANAWTGAARGAAVSQARRQQSTAVTQGIKQATQFWTAALTGAALQSKKRKKHS